MSRDGQLAETFRQAMRIWDGLKADGVPMAERVETLATSLKLAWPFTREWHYYCAACSDTGLVPQTCPEAPCGRQKAHLPHTWGEPCFCKEGGRYKRTAPSADAFTDAGKTPAPAKWTRAGR